MTKTIFKCANQNYYMKKSLSTPPGACMKSDCLNLRNLIRFSSLPNTLTFLSCHEHLKRNYKLQLQQRHSCCTCRCDTLLKKQAKRRATLPCCSFYNREDCLQGSDIRQCVLNICKQYWMTSMCIVKGKHEQVSPRCYLMKPAHVLQCTCTFRFVLHCHLLHYTTLFFIPATIMFGWMLLQVSSTSAASKVNVKFQCCFV